MNKVFKRMLEEKGSKFNPDVVEGTAKAILDYIPQFLSNYIDKTIKILDNDIDLKYTGFKRIDGDEALNLELNVEKKKDTSNSFKFDITESNFNYYKYSFLYNSKIPLSLYLYLPFCNRGNLIKLGNNLYSIVPVLSDTVITPSAKSVFVRLIHDKLNFKADRQFQMLVDGTDYFTVLLYGDIVKFDSKQVKSTIRGKIQVPIGSYILAKYGLKETMQRYSGLREDDWLVTTKDITNEEFKEYKVIQSLGKKIPGAPMYGNKKKYEPHHFKFLIKRDKKISEFTINLVTGIMYFLDTMPDITEDLTKMINEDDLEAEIKTWRIMIGDATLKCSYTVEKRLREVNDMMDSLEFYLDSFSKEKLKDKDMICESFHHLLAIIMNHYMVWNLKYKDFNSNLNNRYIDIIYYLLYDIIISFNKIIRKLKSKTQKDVTIREKEIMKTFSQELGKRKIFYAVRAHDMALCFIKTDYSGDNMYIKGTIQLEDQNRGIGPKRSTNNKNKFPIYTRTLRAEDLLLGNVVLLKKDYPSPRFSLNPWLSYNPDTGKIKLSKEDNEMILALNKLLCVHESSERIEKMVLEEDHDEEDI